MLPFFAKTPHFFLRNPRSSLAFFQISPFSQRKSSPLQEKILKERLNTQINEVLSQNQPKELEENADSWETTPSFLEKGFNFLLIPVGAFSLNILLSQYSSIAYLSSICLVIDWVGYVSSAYVGVYFAFAALKFGKTRGKSENYKYSMCFPTLLALNTGLCLISQLNWYFFVPMSFPLMLSFWKDYTMAAENSLPRFFINFKLKLILLTNVLFLMIVLSLINNLGYNKKMFAMKREIEQRIAENLERFKQEDEKTP